MKTQSSNGGANWNEFLDPLTKHTIVKKGRLPSKKRKPAKDESMKELIKTLSKKDKKLAAQVIKCLNY